MTTPSESASFLDPKLNRLLIHIARLALLLLALHALWLFAPAIRWTLGVLSPFLVGLVLAYVLDPVVTVVQQRLSLGRVGGLVVLTLLLLVIALVVLGIAIPILAEQIAAVVTALQTQISEGLPTLLDSRLLARWEIELAPETRAQINDFLTHWREHVIGLLPLAREMMSEGVGLATAATGAVTGLALGAVAWIMALTFVGIITFYLLLDFDRIAPTIDTAVPGRHRERFWKIAGVIHVNLSGFLRGQILVCLIMGAMVTAGLLVVGPRKYALLIGLLVGMVNFVPYLGPIIGAAPAVLWALLTPEIGDAGEHLIQVVKIVAVFAAAQTIDGLLISPRVIGAKAQMHPLLVMLALIVGAQAGIGGMIIAVPTAIIAKALFTELVWRPMVERRRREACPAET